MVKASRCFPTDRSKVAPVLQFFIVRTSVVSYVAFVFSLCVPHYFFLSVPPEGCAS